MCLWGAGRDVSAIALTGDIINERSQGSLLQVGPSTRQDSVMDSAARVEAGNGKKGQIYFPALIFSRHCLRVAGFGSGGPERSY
jgi:hypothetical protein